MLSRHDCRFAGNASFTNIKVYEESDIAAATTQIVIVAAVLGILLGIICCLCMGNLIVMLCIAHSKRRASKVKNNLLKQTEGGDGDA